MREELVILIVMLGISVVGFIATKNDKKYAVAVLLAAAVAGSLTAGMGVRFREIVEGPFGFLDAALSVVCAAVFVRVLEKTGAFDTLLEKILGMKNRTLKALCMALLIALPGMLTGFATASVVTTGALVGKRMKDAGVAQDKIARTVVIGAFLGMMLPPNCMPAMIAANGAGSVLPTPYVGFFLPLLVLSLPAFVVYVLVCRDTLGFAAEARKVEPCRVPLIVAALTVAALLVEGLLSSVVYIGGNVLVYTIAVILLLILGRCGARTALDTVSAGLMDAAVPVAMMFALGSFIEVTSMTGIRGYFSLKILGIEIPVVMLVLMALSIVIGLFLGTPLPGFLAAYAVFPIGWLANTVIVTGVASSLGIAYLLAMRGGLVGDTVNALGLTDVSWKGTVKHLLLPAALLLAMGVVMVVFGDSMTALIL